MTGGPQIEDEDLREVISATWRDCPEGEPVSGKTYRADGWAYFDPPGTFSPETWDRLLSTIGRQDEQYVALIVSSGVGPSGPWRRGQLLISPDGMANLKRHALDARAAAAEARHARH